MHSSATQNVSVNPCRLPSEPVKKKKKIGISEPVCHKFVSFLNWLCVIDHVMIIQHAWLLNDPHGKLVVINMYCQSQSVIALADGL